MVVLTKYKKEDFDNILESYSIGMYKSHSHISCALQNTIYLVKTTKGKHIIKIFEGADENFIKYQLRITDYLSNHRIPVAKTLKSRSGKEIIIYNLKKITMQKFLKGKPPKRLTKTVVKNIAKKLSLMNKYLLRLKLRGGDKWPVDHQFKMNPIKVNVIDRINFKKAEKNLISDLKSIDRKKLRKGIIHSDFRDSNLLFTNNKLNAILDFDDSHVDYLAYELAVFIMSMLEKGVSNNTIKLFLSEYQRKIKLTPEERKAIYYFIIQRILGVIFWHSKQMNLHKDLKRKLRKGQKRIIQVYLKFSQMSLEDFVNLF